MDAALKALAEPRRREILRLVWTRELPATSIADHFGEVTRSAISQHLGVLKAAGLVSERRDGTRRLYQARQDEMRKLRDKTALPGFSKWPPEFREVSMGYMATNPEGLKRWLEIHHNSQHKGVPAQAQRTTITFDKLATIRVPTLLMPGDQDVQCPPWVMRRQLARIPGAEFIVLPEASHSINWEQPEAFNRHVLEFIHKH